MTEQRGPVTTVDLLRHGECEGGEIFRGSIDVALTARGRGQMYQAINGLGSWQLLCSSSLQRCSDFASELAAASNAPLKISASFREIHFGDWEGIERQRVEAEQTEQLRRFWHDPINHGPPNGESMADFTGRVYSSFDQLLAQHQGQKILFVTHGAVIRVLMCRLLNMPITSMSLIAVPYASISRFTLYHHADFPTWTQLSFHRGETPEVCDE